MWNSIPKMEQMFHVEHFEGHGIAACGSLVSLAFYFPLVSFHRNDSSSAVSFTSCVIDTPALCPAFNS